MSNRKPVLKVWCLPSLSEESIKTLHAELVGAAVSVNKLGLKDERDVIVLFPDDKMEYGLGSEILAEYADVEADWKNRSEREQLAAKIGNVLKKHFPAAFVQCEVSCITGKVMTDWTSKQSATRTEVELIQATATKLLPAFAEAARENCCCEANAIDHKGPCGRHNKLAAYEWAVREGLKIIALKDGAEFQAATDIYVREIKEENPYAQIRQELGWEPKPGEQFAA